ncbi:SDR family oxidoreductase [Ramlibacter sp. PS3R-8]|uniref:SDR family oxidoreductase n=1 Tax=Ramlibacter sp. PS3R-8 TaxID=3133437 RepID=UPI00309B5108
MATVTPLRTLAELGDLSGRVAVLTGGAGHIGRAMAEALAERDAVVCLVDRDAPALQSAADALRGATGATVHALPVDLEDEAQRVALPQRVRDLCGRADVLVNNAGFVGDSALQGWVAPFEQQSIATWRRALEVNLTAAFHLAQLFAPLLQEGGHGSIVNVGSIYGVVGPDMDLYEGTAMGNPAAYAISKGGLVQATRWLATVLGPHVRVNCISPGGVARGQAPAFVQKYEARTPLKRMGREEDFKGAIAFLASDLSAWVTGQNLMVDGGWTAW